MSALLRLFGMYVLGAGVCALGMSGADAAPAAVRGAYSGARANMYGTNTARMPSSPSLTLNNVGNVSTGVRNNNISVSTTPSNPKPDPETSDNCADAMTVEECMTMIASCVNGGALPNGINDLFDADVRNAIMNGMGLCSAQVDMCLDGVKIKTENGSCTNVYNAATDVWIDFNSRRVQPEYYNFVLRKTGLTPNQAENTCWLLDRNVYGTSFTALNEDNYNGNPQWQVTNEYGKSVASYNQQADPRDGEYDYKTKPAGLTVNSNGFYDAQRGHYARWDAKTATCLVRVAAYNKDKHITNSWLFDAIGDERPAEVWRAAGESFTCNKDLFGFSLMNDTKTVAVVGVGGGAVLGAGVGAAFIHGDRAFDCSKNQQLKALSAAMTTEKLSKLNMFVKTAATANVPAEAYKFPVTGGTLTKDNCTDIVGLYEKYVKYKTEYTLCDGDASSYMLMVVAAENCNEWSQCLSKLKSDKNYGDLFKYCDAVPENVTESEKGLYGSNINSLQQCAAHLEEKVLPTKLPEGMCSFRNMLAQNADVRCSDGGTLCVPKAQIGRQLGILDGVFDAEVSELLQGQKNNVGKALGIGTAVGAGAGGLATAITALVEKENISCRVGDGLAQVGLNKAHRIDTLKDFYVKWNLRLPDAITPAKTIKTYEELKQVCKLYSNTECDSVQVNFKAGNKIETLYTICKFDDTMGQCLVNDTVATSHGLTPAPAQ
ncbi:MAG: hypothetical protein R8N24_01265 [Alphaproteobacteria bacterium]|nr:hypothetical protein [Alphaproteobacteria bacterium]